MPDTPIAGNPTGGTAPDTGTGTTMATLTSLIDSDAPAPRRAEALFKRGRLHWQQGRTSAAMTDWACACHLDPSSPASTALAQARDIAAFYNPDLYNP